MKNIAPIGIITGLILVIPLTLQLTIGTGIDGQGFNWKLGDFIVMGVLLFLAGLAIDYTSRKITNPVYRNLTIISIALTLLIIWADLAVGIFNIPGISGS